MLAWGAYVAGEIESAAGRCEPAERHYRTAIDLARRSGATFLVGVATVGLLAVRADAGRIDDALRGYREVVDYFARTGNWTHLWTTLRNLADLLRRLGDQRARRRCWTPRPTGPRTLRPFARPGDAPRADQGGCSGSRPGGPPRRRPASHRPQPQAAPTARMTGRVAPCGCSAASTNDSSATHAV